MRQYIAVSIFAPATLVFHLIGLSGFYVSYQYYDIFMHILGGVTIALFVYALLVRRVDHENKRRLFSWMLAGVFVMGIVWELYEAYFNIAGYPVGTKLYYLDTLKDLVDDMIGGGVVTCFLWIQKPR